MVPVKKLVAKGGKKKKQVLKFTLDCTHPVEDGIMDAANFVSYTLDATQDSDEPSGMLLRKPTCQSTFPVSGSWAALQFWLCTTLGLGLVICF